jgi:predicted aldo/keto reductase-like oxidoreductase
MPYRKLGRTEERVSALGLGGFHIGKVKEEEESIKLIWSAIDQAIEAARTFKPLTQEQIAALLERTAQAAASGKYELFKTEAVFDSTAHHPQWLG